MSEAKAEILRRIREATADGPVADPVQRTYRRTSSRDRAEVVEMLRDRLIDYRASVRDETEETVAAAIAGVIMVAVMWTVLSGMGVFSALQDMLGQLESGGGGSTFDLMDYIGFGRMVSLSVVIGVIDIVLLTAIATLAAFLYNICASLVGGIQLTLSDE